MIVAKTCGEGPRAPRSRDPEQKHRQQQPDGGAEQAADRQHRIDREPVRAADDRQHVRDRQQEDRDRHHRTRSRWRAPAPRRRRTATRARPARDRVAARIERARRIGQRLRDDPRQDEGEPGHHRKIERRRITERRPRRPSSRAATRGRGRPRWRSRRTARSAGRSRRASSPAMRRDHDPQIMPDELRRNVANAPPSRGAPAHASDRGRHLRDWPRRARARSPRSVPSATRRPRSMMPMRSASRSATSRICVVSSTALPARVRARSRSFTTRAEAASSPVSGSSRIISFGSWISAPASATFCFMPRENPSQRAWRCSHRPSVASRSSARGCGDGGRHRPQAGDEFEIFQRIELVVEHRLVRQPGDDALGRHRIAPGVDAEHLDRRRRPPRKDPRSSAGSSSCPPRSARAARRTRRPRFQDRARRRPEGRGRSSCGGRTGEERDGSWQSPAGGCANMEQRLCGPVKGAAARRAHAVPKWASGCRENTLRSWRMR